MSEALHLPEEMMVGSGRHSPPLRAVLVAVASRSVVVACPWAGAGLGEVVASLAGLEGLAANYRWAYVQLVEHVPWDPSAFGR